MKKTALAAGLGLLGAVLWLGTPRAQFTPIPTPAAPDSRFAGLQWTFARIQYTAWTMPPRGGFSMYDEPWYIDAPAAEWNLSRRLRSATSIQVNDPINLTIENPELMNHPWIYIVEPGNLRLKDTEVPILREYLLRGGTLTFDDFHGPIEWANLERGKRFLLGFRLHPREQVAFAEIAVRRGLVGGTGLQGGAELAHRDDMILALESQPSGAGVRRVGRNPIRS